MRDSEKRMFEYFLAWVEKETVSPGNWVFTKSSVSHNGVDLTDDMYKWMQIKLSKGATAWLTKKN